MRRVILLSVVAVLASPSAAGAKEVGSLTLCGTNGCHGVHGDDARRGFEDSGMTAPAPDRAERFLQLRVRIREGDEQVFGFSVRWLPGADVIRSADDRGYATWTRPAAALSRALRRAARGLEPKPAAALGTLRTAPPPRAQVDEVYEPAAARSPRTDEGGTSTLGVAAGAGALALLAAGLARRARRPH
jgi:hypothetical protein